MLRPRILLASFLLAAGCSSAAHADRIAVPGTIGPRTALAIAPAKIRAPYDVQVIREGGDTLPTYALKDRYYVQGNAGERYIIRVTNPTAEPRRGGRHDRWPRRGRWRDRVTCASAATSCLPTARFASRASARRLDDVATFRFSSVDDSYAGKKGKARNVGVIAVALFEEEAAQQQQIIVEPPPPPNYRQPYDYEDDLDVSSRAPGPRGGVAKADKAPSRPAPRPWWWRGQAQHGAGRGSPGDHERRRYRRCARAAHAHGRGRGVGRAARRGAAYAARASAPSSASRATPPRRSPGSCARPIARSRSPSSATTTPPACSRSASTVQPLPDEGELMTRETADPFPGDNHFATPPR